MEVKNLPENVLRNIIEFKLGEPEYIKLKHSKGLREIQNKYRITTTEPEFKAYKLRLIKGSLEVLTSDYTESCR